MPVPSGHNVPAVEFGPVVTTAAAASVSNTTTETVIASYSIPGGTAQANDAFAFDLNGTCDITGTPTITFRLRIGGLAGTALAAIAYTAAANTQRPWWLRGRLRCVSTGAAGTWHGFLTHGGRIAGGASPGISALWDDGTANAQTKDTTVLQDLAVTVQWSVASASNTLRVNDVDIAKRLG